MAFLQDYISKNENSTHTSFIGGKYFVSETETETFNRDYYEAQKTEDLYLTERISPNFNFFMDIDTPITLRNFDIQKFTISLISDIQTTIVNNFNDTLDFEHIITTRFSKVHINFPHILVDSERAKLILKELVSLASKNPNIDSMIKDNFDTMFDFSVYRSGLRMYGSRKAKKSELSEQLKYNLNKDTYETKYNLHSMNNQKMTFKLFKKTLIRSPLNDAFLISYKEPQIIKVIDNKVLESNNNSNNSNLNVIEKDFKLSDAVIQQLKDFLNYLKTIDYKNIDLTIRKITALKSKANKNIIYINIGEKHCPFEERLHNRSSSPLYLELSSNGICIRCYDEQCKIKRFPEEFIKIPQENRYVEILKVLDPKMQISTDLTYLMKKSLSATHFSVAKVIFELYKNKFRVEGIKKGAEWYEFKNHRWQSSVQVYIDISEDFCEYYKAMIDNIIDDKDEETEATDEEKEGTKKSVLASVYKLLNKCEMGSYKTSLMTESSYLFHRYDVDFYQKLNENRNYLAFNNGVYDLKKRELRSGKINDYITFTTKIDCVPYDPEHPITKEIMTFWSQVFRNPKVGEYVLKIIGRTLSGDSDEHFYIFKGFSGANGKSTVISLIERTFGDYVGTLSVSLLTDKRASSNSATPEIIGIKGKRLITFQEPEGNSKLNTGIFKQISGDDTIIARELFKAPVEFKSQSSLIMCCNDLPRIADTDGGTWRRIQVINFGSKFCDNPTKENEYPRDPNLKNKFESWKPYMMSILIHYYNKGVDEGIEIPEEVAIETKEYRQDNDIIQQFLEEKTENCVETFTTIKQLYLIFNEWFNEVNNFKAMSSTEFRNKLDAKLGKAKVATIRGKKDKGYYIKIIYDELELQIDETESDTDSTK